MRIEEIWRYPVKSMAGEMLETAELTEAGVMGDRVLQVRNAKGRIITARTNPLLLRHHAAFGPDGQVLVDGHPWNAKDVGTEVEVAAGVGTRRVESDFESRFDILPLLVATDGMLNTLGENRRRFRPNLVISGVAGLGEREWEGAQLRIGSVVVGMEDLRDRCIMTTFDPDTGKQDVDILRRIYKEFSGKLGLNSYVVTPGRISVGDAVELIAAS
jgi:uncharacterized protein YcbX